MQVEGTEKAKRAADLLYSFAAIVVFTLILPSAILVATFFIFGPIIPDEFVRVLLSASVGIFVGGLLLHLTGRRTLGSILHVTNVTLAAVSLSMGWGTFHALIACFHGALIGYYFVFFNLKRKEILSEKIWKNLRNLLSILIVLSGPLAVRGTLLFYGHIESLATATIPITMLLYVIVFHFVYLNTRFGIAEVILASITGGLVANYILTSAVGTADLSLTLSSFLIGTGIAMVTSTQIARKVQFYIYSRPLRIEKKEEKKAEKVTERDRILRVMGIESAPEPEPEPEPAPEPEPENEDAEVELPLIPILIDTYDGQAISGIGLILLASGIPVVFLWLAQLTTWGSLPEFPLLMSPIAMLFALLVAIPAPVFIRLSARITRDRESHVVKFIGLAIVFATCSILFFWTQFFSWLLIHSVSYASLMFLAGITGLFRTIRRLWRALWLGIVGVFRRIKRWILAHILLAGIIIDALITSVIVLLVYPSFSILPAPFISIPAAAAITFSFFAFVGATSLKRHPRRISLVSFSFTILLLSLTVLTYWQQHFVSSIGIVDSVSFASLWLLGSAALIKLKISKRKIGLLYLPGVAGASYLVWKMLDPLIYGFFPLLTIIVALVLLTPLAYTYYIRIGHRIAFAARYVGEKIVSGIRLLGNALVRAITAVGRVLKRFVFGSWALILILILTYLGFSFVMPFVESDPIRTISILGVLFVLGYFPMLAWEERTSERMLKACLVAMAASIGIAVFVFTPGLNTLSRMILSYGGASLVLMVFKGHFDEQVGIYLRINTYLSFLSLAVLEVFFYLSASQDILQSGLFSISVFGFGMLPLRKFGASPKWSDVAYGVLAIPATSILVFLLSGDLLISLVAFLLLPIPIAYQKYVTGARIVGAYTARGIRIIILFAAINLVIVFLFLGLVISTILIQYLAPLLSQYPIPEIPISLTFATIALVFWLPALFLRRGEHSKLFMVIVPVLATVMSTNAVVLLNLPDIIQTIALAICLTLIITTLTKRLYPERFSNILIPITIISIVFLGSWTLFLNLLPSLGYLQAGFTAMLAGGFGTLLLKPTKTAEKIVAILFLALSLPSSIALAYLFGFGIFGIILALLLIPIPVAYRQYIRVLSAFASALALGIKVVIAYIVIYLIIAMGVASILLATALIYLLLPLFASWPIPMLPIGLSFLVLFLLFWLPALFMRRSENEKTVSVVLVVFAAITSLDVTVLLQIVDPILGVLTTALLFGILLLFGSPYITLFDAIRSSFAITLGSAILIGAYYVPVDFVMKTLLIIVGYSCISLLFIGKEKRIVISYPLISGSILAVFFYQLYLFGFDPIGLGLAFLCMESLLLSFADELKSKPLWWFFSIIAALFVAWLLSPFYLINYILAAFIGIELIRYAPLEDIDYERFALPLGIIRSVLLSTATYLFLSIQYTFLFTIQVTALVFVVILHVSVRTVLPPIFVALTSLSAAALTSLIIYTHFITNLSVDPILSLYPSIIPIALFSYIRAVIGPYKQTHWFILSTAIAICFGLPWFIFYGTISSLILVATTFLFILVIFQLWQPKVGYRSGIVESLSVLSFVLMLESIWIWHAVLIFYTPLTPLLAVSSIIALVLVLLPVTDSVAWLSFEMVWELICAYFAITTSALLISWEITSLTLPPNLVLYAGLVLTLFSATSTPPFVYNESTLKMDESERVGHYTWLPALPGWGLLGAFVTSIVTPDMIVILSIGFTCFAIAGLIFGALVPGHPRRIFEVFDAILATSSAIVFGVYLYPNYELPALLAICAIIWYVIAFPITFEPTTRFLAWLADLIRRNARKLLHIVPLFFGFIAAWPYAAIPDPYPILDLYIRNYLFAISLGLIVTGIFFLVFLQLFRHLLTPDLKVPSILLMTFGVNSYYLAGSLPPAVVALEVLVVHVVSAAIVSCILLIILAAGTGQNSIIKQVFGVLGIALSIAVLRWHLIDLGSNPLVAGLWTLAVLFVFALPFLWRYVLLIITNFFSLGTLIMKGLKVLAKKLTYLFDRWGYVLWTLFSIAFTITLAVLTYPFFSELLNMPIVGFLYPVPSISIPMMILGLMLLALAIVRRKVKSRLGIVGGFLSAVGFGITAGVALYDNGHPYLAVAIAIFCACLAALVIREEIEISDEYIAIFWIPIPLSISSIILYYLYVISTTLEAQILAFFLAFFPSICLFLLSTLFGWIPKRLRNHLWITLSIFSGLIAYLSSYLAVYPFLASIYLSVLIAAFVLYPITGRKMTQLFLAPIAFAVTGFAFTFVLGEFYQSLLLGLAASLLFVSRYLKQIESERPQLAYVRLAVLVALVISIALFVVTLVLFVPAV